MHLTDAERRRKTTRIYLSLYNRFLGTAVSHELLWILVFSTWPGRFDPFKITGNHKISQESITNIHSMS
jgi:hypothetical protein